MYRMCINLRYHVENVWINEFPSNKVSGMTHTQYTLHRIDASKMFQWKLMKEEKAINLYNMQIAFVCSFDSWFFLGMNKLFSYVIPLRILNNVAVQWQFNWRIWRDILHFDTYSLVAIAVLGKWLAVWLFFVSFNYGFQTNVMKSAYPFYRNDDTKNKMLSLIFFVLFF